MHPLQWKKQEREMKILSCINMLRFATQRHLMAVIDMGGIRNANRIMNELRQFLRVYPYGKENVYYLNRAGRELFEDAEKVVPSGRMDHHLLRNEAWLMCNCPDDWRVEPLLSYRKDGKERRIIPDALYLEGKELHAVEVDRTQSMKSNEEKLKRYAEYSELYKKEHGKIPILHVFTITSHRKNKWEKLADKYRVYAIVTFIPEI